MGRNPVDGSNWLSAVLLLTVVALASLLGGAEPGRKAGAKGADTPQALAVAYRRALAQKDWRACYLCYDSKMRGRLLMEMFFMLGVTRDSELAAVVKKRVKVEVTEPDRITIPGLRQDDRVPDELLWYEALQKRVDDLPGFADEFCRRLDAMGEEVFPGLGQVREIRIQGDRAIGYWTRPPLKPIGPTMTFLGGKTVDVDGNAPLPYPQIPSGPGHPNVIGLPGIPPESERREPVYFRRIGRKWRFTFPDPPPPLSPVERGKQLQAEVESLWVLLTCSSERVIGNVLVGDSYCELRLSVRPFVYTSDDPNLRLARITEAQASRMIDHLAAEGFLQQAVELGKQKIPQRALSENCYTLQVSTQNLSLHEDLGWGPAMLKRLDGLRTALEGDAAEAMDALLARLAEERRKWAVEALKPIPARDRASHQPDKLF